MRRVLLVAASLTAFTLLLGAARAIGGVQRSPQVTYASIDGALSAYDVDRDMTTPLVRGLDQLPVAWSWSPDGATLAYVLLDSFGGGYDIVLWSPLLRRSTALVDGLPFGSPPQWSPDGRHIAAVDMQQDICLYPIAGGAPSCLNVQPAGQPVWSPDGAAIAYLSRLPRGGLRRVDISSGDMTPLFTGVDGLNHPRWSPDGALIAFSHQPGFDRLRHVYVVPSGGGAVRELADGTISQDQPQWSPDSTLIAFNATASGARTQSDAAVVDVGTGLVRFVTAHPMTDTDPRWSPDGRWLAFVSDRFDVRPRLLVVPVANDISREAPAIVGVEMRLYAFAWRP